VEEAALWMEQPTPALRAKAAVPALGPVALAGWDTLREALTQLRLFSGRSSRRKDRRSEASAQEAPEPAAPEAALEAARAAAARAETLPAQVEKASVSAQEERARRPAVEHAAEPATPQGREMQRPALELELGLLEQ